MENIYEKINKLSKKFYPQAIDFTQKLLKIPNLLDSEEDIVDLYIKEMNKLGYDKVFKDEVGNVIGIVKGNEVGPTIMYNSYIDSIEVGNIDNWGANEAEGGDILISKILLDQNKEVVREDDRICGHAVDDCKVGGASQIYGGAILLKLREMGYRIKGDYIFTGVIYKEKEKDFGMKHLLDETFKNNDIKYDGVVSSEPTGLNLYIGYEGHIKILVTIEEPIFEKDKIFTDYSLNKSLDLTKRIEDIINENAKIADEIIKCNMCVTVTNYLRETKGKNMVYNKRFVAGENYEDCINQIQQAINELSKEVKGFRAKVEIISAPRNAFVGKKIKRESLDDIWSIDRDSQYVKEATGALMLLDQDFKYGYWNYARSLSIITVRDKKPIIGYSPIKEFYIHKKSEEDRLHSIEKALAGNAGIFISLCRLSKDDFKIK